MSQPQSGNDLLMSGGVKACKFDNLGDTNIGTIVDEAKAVQMTKYQSDELDFWPSGDPKMQVVVTIQTDQRDPSNALDDGRRRLHIPPRMMQPVREAILRAGAKGLAIGGRIAVRWVSGTGQGEGNPKVYAAEYQAPAVDPGGLLAGATNGATPPPSTPQPAEPVQPMLAAPAAAPVATPAAPQPAASAIVGSMLAGPVADDTPPPGVDPTKWATLPDAQKAAVRAAMAGAGF